MDSARTRGATAVLVATAPALDGGPAAALPADGRTLLERLLAQLHEVGVERVVVVTRPDWRDAVAASAASAAVPVDVRTAGGADEDLQAVAEVAGRAEGRLLVGHADVLLHARPLAVLLADPGVRSGVLLTTPLGRAEQAFRIRVSQLRVVGADSAHHRMERPNGFQLGWVVVDPADLPALADAARAMAAVAAEPVPEEWADELERKAAAWRAAEAARVGAAPSEAGLATDAGGAISEIDVVAAEGALGGDPAVLAPEAEERVAHRVRVAAQDALPLLVVALVRSGMALTPVYLRAFFAARPVSREGAAEAAALLAQRDEDRLALDSAVKATDGFFTTFFVSPYSRYVARFAARRGWTPNAMTIVSMLIGILSAAAFATGARAGMIAGAILLQAAFTVDCVDGQLARYTLQFSKLGSWLDSTFDRAKEYVVFAGLAIGAARGFDQHVWTLAAAALTLQTFRHMVVFAFDASRQEERHALPSLPFERAADVGDAAPAAPARDLAPVVPGGARDGATALAPVAAPLAAPAPVAAPAPRPPLALRPIHAVAALDRFNALRWLRRIWLLPIGERFALISITAACCTPRVTFVALLAWGGATAIWGVAGRVLRSVG